MVQPSVDNIYNPFKLFISTVIIHLNSAAAFAAAC